MFLFFLFFHEPSNLLLTISQPDGAAQKLTCSPRARMRSGHLDTVFGRFYSGLIDPHLAMFPEGRKRGTGRPALTRFAVPLASPGRPRVT